MKKLFLLTSVFLINTLLMVSCSEQHKGLQLQEEIKGHLFIIGGGSRPAYMMEKYIELAGGRENAKIIIIPFAGADVYNTGVSLVNQFKKNGCENTHFAFFNQGEADFVDNLNVLEGATGIYFCGGRQTRHTKMLLGTQFIEKIREIYVKGGVIGGTSAGAAIMSEIMLNGEELVDTDNSSSNAFSSIKKDNIGTTEGFGFLKNVIVDQHFVARKRMNRLLSLVIENQMPGIGIDEATALIVKPDLSFEVLGESCVMVFEPDKNFLSRTDKNGHLSADRIITRILLSGDTFKLAGSK